MPVSSPWPRAVGENRIAGAREPTSLAGAAEGLYATNRKSVILTLRLRPWTRHRCQVAQGSGPPSRDGCAFRVRQSAAPSVAARGESVRLPSAGQFGPEAKQGPVLVLRVRANKRSRLRPLGPGARRRPDAMRLGSGREVFDRAVTTVRGWGRSSGRGSRNRVGRRRSR